MGASEAGEGIPRHGGPGAAEGEEDYREETFVLGEESAPFPQVAFHDCHYYTVGISPQDHGRDHDE